jgi:hypothetical protein
VAAGGGSGGRGACKRGQRRGEIGPGQGKSDAWRPTKQEVERQRRHSGGRGRCTAPAVEEQNRAARTRGRRREGRGLKGLCAKLKDSKGLSVKQNFSLI